MSQVWRLEDEVDPYSLTTEQFISHAKYDSTTPVRTISFVPPASQLQEQEPPVPAQERKHRGVISNIMDILGNLSAEIKNPEIPSDTCKQYLETLQGLKDNLNRLPSSTLRDTVQTEIDWLTGKLQSRMSYSPFQGEELDDKHVSGSSGIGKIAKAVTEIENKIKSNRQAQDSIDHQGKGKERDDQLSNQELIERLDQLQQELSQFKGHPWQPMQSQRIKDLISVLKHGTLFLTEDKEEEKMEMD